MNILVTGAKGMVGTALVNNLKNISVEFPLGKFGGGFVIVEEGEPAPPPTDNSGHIMSVFKKIQIWWMCLPKSDIQ